MIHKQCIFTISDNLELMENGSKDRETELKTCSKAYISTTLLGL